MASVSPATRRRIPRAEREGLMLDAAEGVFSEAGFHGASMDAIAKAAGISKPMLYNYFGSKDGLYLAYLTRAGADLTERLAAVDPGPDAPLDARLEAGARAFFEYVHAHRAGWSVLRDQLSRQGEPLEGQVAGARDRIVVLVTALLEETGTGGTKRDRDAFAHAFVGAGEALADWWLDHPRAPVGKLTGMLAAMSRGALAGD